MRRFARSTSAALLFFAAASGGCARNPVTGDLQLALISEQQEIEMGRQGAADVEQSIGLVDDPALQSYVSAIGTRMAATSQRPNLPWTFGVVDDPTPNAFALPGGYIYLTRGIMSLMSTEAQLATVLGHEIGHVTARHHVTQLSRTQLAQLGLGVGGILFPEMQTLGGIAGAGLQLVFLSHSRDAERQADDLGFGYALTSGFDVREMPAVFASLQRLGDQAQRSAVPSWLLTHPEPGDRIAATQQRLQAATLPAQLRIGAQPYMDAIDGLIYGQNPRNGFFRDDLFLHPDLRFQLRMPASWQRQNLSQAVLAVSPQQDAAIQLTVAEDANVDAAAQRFLGQQGLQVGQTSRQAINGLPAVMASFRAQTEQQLLQGVIAFIAHGGLVYQIIGYSPAAVYPNHEQTFLQTLRSFAQLTDPQALAAQPNRLRVVRTTETMTLTQFNNRFPSVIPMSELVILNQVSGPDAVISAGTFVKRVVAG